MKETKEDYIKSSRILHDIVKYLNDETIGNFTLQKYEDFMKNGGFKTNTELLFLLISYNVEKLYEFMDFEDLDDVRDNLYRNFSNEALDKVQSLEHNLDIEDLGLLVRELINSVYKIIEE